MKLKRVILTVLLIALSLSLYAEQAMGVNWKWGNRDPEVQYYRYQVDGDNEDSWVVVPSDVMAFSIEGLDPYVDHTFYLQSSYDGVAWSESAVSVAPAMLIYAEELEEPIEEKWEYSYVTNFLLSFGASQFIPAVNPQKEGGNIFGLPFTRYDFGVDFQNIVHAGPWGMGLRMDISSVVMPIAGDWNNTPKIDKFFHPYSWWYDSSIDLKLMMYFGNRVFDFYFGGGFGYSIFSQRIKDINGYQEEFGHSFGDWGVYSSALYVPAIIGFRGRFNKVVSLGFDIDFRYLIPANRMSLATSITLGFSC